MTSEAQKSDSTVQCVIDGSELELFFHPSAVQPDTLSREAVSLAPACLVHPLKLRFLRLFGTCCMNLANDETAKFAGKLIFDAI